MNRLEKIFILPCFLAILLFLNGSSDKTLFPEVNLEIPSVTPYELYSTATNSAMLSAKKLIAYYISLQPDHS